MSHIVGPGCTPSVIDKVVGEGFASALQCAGFEKAPPRKYVRTAHISHAPCRRTPFPDDSPNGNEQSAVPTLRGVRLPPIVR
jgi:hypothetical protein